METGVSLDEAIQISLTVPLSRRTERVSIEDARGRVTAVPLLSKVDDPGFDNSAMDGFAVRESDCENEGARLEIVGTSQAGGAIPPEIGAGQACRIMTGATLPAGADAIVMIEDTEIDGKHVVINGPARAGFIRRKAENLSIGQGPCPLDPSYHRPP